MKQHEYSSSVVYVQGGSRFNALVLQSTVHVLNGEEEEHLVLAYCDTEMASQTMSGNAVQQAIKTAFGVRPLAKTKPVNDESGTQGVGWADLDEATSDTDVLKDGPLLKDLVDEINATNPLDSYGHDLKDNEKFKAAAKHLGIAVTDYDHEAEHAKISKEIEFQGKKPISAPPPAQTSQPIAAPDIKMGQSEGEGKSQEKITKEKQAFEDPSKAAEAFGDTDINNMAQATHDAIVRGDLHPTAVNNKPEDHPEFGTNDLVEPDKLDALEKTSGDGKDAGDWTTSGDGTDYPGSKKSKK